MNTTPPAALSLTVFDDRAGGLIFLLSDGRSLALHELITMPEGGVAAWQGVGGVTSASELLRFGRELARAWLPAAVAAELARQGAGCLNLQIGAALIALPWELAALTTDDADPVPCHLDAHFTVVRRILTPGAPAPAVRVREPGALLEVLHGTTGSTLAEDAPRPGRFGPLLLRVHAADSPTDSVAHASWQRAIGSADIVHLHGQGATNAAAALADPAQLAALPHGPRLLIAEGLAAAGAALAASACRAGISALVLPVAAPLARAAFYAAVAKGAPFAVAAQRARAAARQAEAAGGDAWFYGDGQHAPLRPDVAAAPGAPAVRVSWPDGDVRQVTILACDLVDSTGLIQRLGNEEYSERLIHYHRRVAAIAQQHHGLADDPQGDDGVMCYFGYPVASEDAAAAALRAGLALSRALDDLGLAVRVGISTGRVVIRNGQPVGTAVHHAARLQSCAGTGGVLASAATRQIAGEGFEFSLEEGLGRLKGFDDGAAVYRVHKAHPPQDTERFDVRAQLSNFIGREAELARLQQHWLASLAGRRQVLQLRGEAGIGKSRLVHEFRSSLAAAGQRTLECRCAPEHSGSAFQPLIDLLRKRLKIAEADDPALQLARLRQLEVVTGPDGEHALALLGALLSLPAAVLPRSPVGGPVERRQYTMDLLARVALGLSNAAPVCLVVEDVHWIDPSTRELVQRLIDGPPEQRVLLLLTLRSTAAASDPPVAAADDGFAVPTLWLSGLNARDTQALLLGATGGAWLDADIAAWLAQRADGVPLFIEESARMAAALHAQQPGADMAAALRDAVPATLQDLLMARLDQLPRAKRAAQLGAALGRAFSQPLVQAVNAHPSSPIRLPLLDQELAALARAGLVSVQGEGEFRSHVFKHALVRDAAYQSLLERDRRALHRTIAAVLQDQFSALCASQLGLLPLHHEQAGMAAEALAGWEHAARHAAQRSAHGEAIAHLRRALVLLAGLASDSELERTELRLQLMLAARLIATAGYGADAVEAVYQRAQTLCQLLGDAAALTKVRLGLEGYHFMRGDFARAQAMADEVAADLGQSSEPAARLQSTWARTIILFHQGKLPQALALMDHCLADYGHLGHRPAAVQDPGVMCLCYSSWALWELGQADQSLQRAHRAVELAERLGHRLSMGEAYGFLAVAHYFHGETAPGLAAAQRAIEVCEAGGFVVWLAHAKVVYGRLLAERGDPGDLAAGLESMREGHTMWAATGAVVTLPFYGVLRAEGLALAGRSSEALTLIEQAQALISRHGERYYEPEVQRMKGVLLLQTGAPVAEAEAWLQRGLDSAQDLRLPGMALKSATALASLWQAQGQAARAQTLLVDVLAGLSEGLDTRDPRQAQTLLAQCRADVQPCPVDPNSYSTYPQAPVA